MKGSGRLSFSLFIINQYCTPKMFYYEKCVFKAIRILFFSLLIINQTPNVIYYETCVFKPSGRLLFRLFIIFQTPNVLLQKTFVQNGWETNFFWFINYYFTPNVPLQKMCVRLWMWTAALSLVIKFYKTSISGSFWFKVVAF